MKFTEGVAQLYFSTVPIEAQGPGGGGSGTALIFNYQTEVSKANGIEYSFLVTNKHVVKDATYGEFFFTEKDSNGDPILGQKVAIAVDDFESKWQGHPSPEIDVAVLPIGSIFSDSVLPDVYVRGFGNASLPSENDVANIDPMDPIVFIGYPNGIYDTKNLLPIARRGSLASPYNIDYEGRPEFLIDASVFPGSSGSPVLTIGPVFRTNENAIRFINNTRLLGIVSSVFFTKSDGEINDGPIPTNLKSGVTVMQMIDLGVVIKTSAILETIHGALRKEGLD